MPKSYLLVRGKWGEGHTYLYDGDGRRVSKTLGASSRLYWYGSGDEVLAETDAAGNTTNEYIFFGGQRIADVPLGSTPVYYVSDMLNTSRVVTTNTGVVCYDADFTPYGGEGAWTDTCPERYRFEGKERDAETINDYFGARYYTERFGRWLSADWSAVPAPVPYANLTNPQTLNLYAMVADDPESFADLDGHDPGCNTGGYATNAGNPLACLGQDDNDKQNHAACTNATCGDQAPLVATLTSIQKGELKEFNNELRDLANLEGATGNPVALLIGRNMKEESASNLDEKLGMLITAIGLALIPGGEEAEALGKGAKVTSQIGKDAQLVRLAEEAGASHQSSLDRLFQQLMKGNLNPGLGTKALGGGISYARSRDGARLFFRVTKGTIEILGKANKGNEAQVIRRVLEVFLK